MNNILIAGIDPGTKESAFVVVRFYELFGFMHPGKAMIEGAVYEENAKLLDKIRSIGNKKQFILAIEKIAYYSDRHAGASTMDTAFWSGAFACSRWEFKNTITMITRPESGTIISGTPRATDKMQRESLIRMFGPQGTKKNPGPLYGIAGDLFAALAVAISAWYKLKARQINFINP